MPTPTEHAQPISREMELLLCCARLNLADEHREKLRVLLNDNISWAAVLTLGRRHRLTPFLFHHLSAFAEQVPAATIAELRQAYGQNARRSLLLSAELREVLAAFARAGIPALPYKGPVLGQQVYGNVALREMSDLDVLVRRRDLVAARDILLERGYKSVPAMVGIPDELALKWDCNLILVREPNRQIFELHWAIAAGRFSFPLPFHDAWSRSGEVLLGGSPVPRFSTEDQLLVLCFHGSRHMWECLEWITGVAELLRRERVDWEVLLERAEHLRSRRRLLLGLLIAHQLLDVPLPANVLEEARAVVPGRALRAVHMVLFAGAKSSGRRFHSFQVAVSDSVRSKARYLLHAALGPAKEDYFALPLPSALFPLYPLIRPFRLARAYGARFARGRP